MKILLLTVGTINYNCDINFFESLKSMGHDVVRYNYYEKFSEIGKEKMNKEIIALAESTYPDYIFFITYQGQISDSTLEELNTKGHKVIGWFSDDHWRFDSYSKNIAEKIFCSITTDNQAFVKYKSNNLEVIKSQWAANPEYYCPISSNVKYDITFVGAKYNPRGSIIDYLLNNNIKVKVFGRGWRNYISFKEIISIFSNSKINLNISASSSDENIKQIKGRVFEVPMCGGFLLTDYVDGLEDYFDIGNEIVCYENRIDLLNKIKFYLANEKKRKDIAMNGYYASLERNTWKNRFDEIFRKLKLLNSNIN